MADDVVVATAGYTSGLGLLRGRVLPGAPAGAGHRAAAAPRRSRRSAGRGAKVSWRPAASSTTSGSPPTTGWSSAAAAPRYHWRGRPPAGEAAAPPRTLRRELAAVFPRGRRHRRLPVTHAWSGVIGYTLDALPVHRPRSRAAGGGARARLVRARPGAVGRVGRLDRPARVRGPRRSTGPGSAAARRCCPARRCAGFRSGRRSGRWRSWIGWHERRARRRRDAGPRALVPIVLGLAVLSAVPAAQADGAPLSSICGRSWTSCCRPIRRRCAGARTLRARAGGIAVPRRRDPWRRAAGPPAAFAAALGARDERVRRDATRSDLRGEDRHRRRAGVPRPAGALYLPLEDLRTIADRLEARVELGEGARQPAVRLARRRRTLRRRSTSATSMRAPAAPTRSPAVFPAIVWSPPTAARRS